MEQLTLPLPAIPRQRTLLRPKRDLRSLGEVENIPLPRLHALARLIADLENAVDDDFHLIISVCVD